MAVNHLSSNTTPELREFMEPAALNPDAAAAVSADRESAVASSTTDRWIDQDELDEQELLVSKIFATMDPIYIPPPFPNSGYANHSLSSSEAWTKFVNFVFYRGLLLESDSVDSLARWLREMLSYLRENRLIFRECTSDLAYTRLLTALASLRDFRRHMRQLGDADSKGMTLLLNDIVSYICYNHHDPPHQRAWRRKRARILAALKVAQSPDSSPTPPAPAEPEPSHDMLEPPPYKARHYKASIESSDPAQWHLLVGQAFGESWRARNEPPLQRQIHVLRSVLSFIQDHSLAAAPYFKDMPDDKLQRVLEGDAGFAAQLQRLMAATDDDDDEFEPTLTRIINHVCQPVKRTTGTSRQVRFAPY